MRRSLSIIAPIAFWRDMRRLWPQWIGFAECSIHFNRDDPAFVI
jgi:hypothetical protein